MARLHSRIYLHFLGVLIVAGIAASAVFAVGARGGPVREIAERMGVHLAALAAERFEDHAALGDRLAEVHATLDVDVTVRDLNGRLVAAAGPERPPLGPWRTAKVASGGIAFTPGSRWHVAVPILDPRSHAVVGMMQIAARHRMAGPRVFGPGLAVVAVLLVAAAATRPLARRISRPLERLTEAVRRFGAGDLAYRVPEPPGPTTTRWSRRSRPGVDELRELTRAFNEMADRVERLVRGQRELLANVSHELRSPLARIRVALSLLPQDGTSERHLIDVERDLDELDELIEDVLTTARLDATGLPVHLAAFSANDLAAQVAERARHDPLVAGREVQVVAGPPLTAIADGALLRRALWNLVENAAKYGAPPIAIEVSSEADRVAWSVTDAGDGIPAGERERVVAAFYRGDRARTPRTPGNAPRGAGLGLTLAQRVAQVHGGSLRIGPAAVEDGRDRGCRVTITIPLTPPASAT